MRRKRTRQGQGVYLTLLAAVVMVAGAAVLPAITPVVGKMAMFSAGLSMPEGSIEALRNRFGNIGASATSQESSLPATEPESPPTPTQNKESSSATVNPVIPVPLTDYINPPLSPKDSHIPVDLPSMQVMPEIPAKYQGELVTEDMSGYPEGPFVRKDSMWLRNYTSYTSKDIADILATPMKMKPLDNDEPQVFIYHTHATEAYTPYDSSLYDKRYNWRSSDNNNNMVAVGAVMADTLKQQGIGVIHDTTQHDYPSYNGSYKSSYDAIKKVLKEHPSIKVVLDVHRDAIERAGAVIVKPTAVIDGEKYAQLMIISNCDDGSGLIPKWQENLRFAYLLADKIEYNDEGLTRPINFSYRKYNQQLSTGGLLLEFGSHASTMDEAKRTAVKVGEALAQVLKEHM